MKDQRNLWISAAVVLSMVAVLARAAVDFRGQFRTDPIVAGPGVSRVLRLSTYYPGIRNRAVDTDVYVLEGRQPGGSVLVISGAHPPEAGAMMAAILLVEQARVSKGRLIVIPQANRSGFTATPAGQGWPGGFTIDTPNGPLRFRIGSKMSNPLHQWPDPDEYVNANMGARWSGEQARDLNRVYPGRSDGYLTERLAYAIMELIRRERVTMVLDMHEAPPDRPLINAIAVHPKGMGIAADAILNLEMADIKVRLEVSPPKFRGLSHREIPESSDAIAMLHETNLPLHGALRGRATEQLILTAQDAFLVKASRSGWTGTTHPPEGVPIEQRVGRHLAMLIELVKALTQRQPQHGLIFEYVPTYDEVVKKGLGALLRVPDGTSNGSNQ